MRVASDYRPCGYLYISSLKLERGWEFTQPHHLTNSELQFHRVRVADTRNLGDL
jgi:hypothetical protein